MSTDHGRAVIEEGALVIRVPLENLQAIVDGAWMLGGLEPRQKITDAARFARDLVDFALNSEDEQGTTPVHRMFDAAINAAIENGADGIEDHEEQEA